MTKKTKPAEQQKSSLLKGRRWTAEELQELREIVELALALSPKERRYKVVTVPFGMDD